MTNNFFNRLTPLFEKKDTAKPIIRKTKEEIRTGLNYHAELERLATKSVNHDPNKLYLEPVEHSLFDIFQRNEERTLEPIEEPDKLTLLSVGNLSLYNYQEEEDEKTKAITTLDLKAYREQRKENEKLITESDINSSTEEYLNQMLEAVLGPERSGMAEETETVVPPPPTVTVNPPVTTTSGIAQVVVQSSDSEMEDVNVTDIDVSETNEFNPPVTTTTNRIQYGTISDHWYNDNMITKTKIHSEANEIFAYKPQMIPIFPTEKQQMSCNQIIHTNYEKISKATFNIMLEKIVNIMNLPSSGLDLDTSDQWKLSGKTIFIKRLLEQLTGSDLIILIVAKDLGEEEVLMEFIEDGLKLECVRINYCLDNAWQGEHGVLVKTAHQKNDVTRNAGDFKPVVDLVICLDIRTSKDNSLFKQVWKRGSSKIAPPVVWLVNIGSFEERIFNYLSEKNITYDTCSFDQLKEIMAKDNTWQRNPSFTVQEMNYIAAANLKSWLTEIGARTQYQYRSTIELPKSTHYAYVKSLPIDEENESVSDMDIASDSEDAQTVSSTNINSTTVASSEPEVVAQQPTVTAPHVSTVVPTSPAVSSSIPTGPAALTESAIPTGPRVPTVIPTGPRIPTAIPTGPRIPSVIPTGPRLPSVIPIPTGPRVSEVIRIPTGPFQRMTAGSEPSERIMSYVDDIIVPKYSMDKGTLLRGDPIEALKKLTEEEKRIVKELSATYDGYHNEVDNLKRQYELAFNSLQREFREKAILSIKRTKK